MGEGSLWAAAHCGPPGSDGQVQVLLTSCHIAVATEAAGEVRGGDVRGARREACQDSSSSLPNVCNSPASRSPSSTGPVLHACTHTHKCVSGCLWANMQSEFSRQCYETPPLHPPLKYGACKGRMVGAVCAKVDKMFQKEKKKIKIPFWCLWSQSAMVQIPFRPPPRSSEALSIRSS